jgi:hypothetical protein
VPFTVIGIAFIAPAYNRQRTACRDLELDLANMCQE